MKFSIYTFLFFTLALNSKTLLAQDTDLSSYSLQLNFGLSSTLHYDQPINLVQCIEGCFPEEQKPRITPNVNLNLYRDFNQKNGLKIGLGVSSYKFWEKGLSNNGDGQSFSNYERVQRWSFYELFLGYRYILNPEKKIKLFVESDLIYEIPVEDYSLIKNGFAIRPKIGVIINIKDNLSLIAEGFYKSGLTNYNDRDFGKDYIPYAYGIQLGIDLKF